MEAQARIRCAEPRDFAGIVELARLVAAAGDAFPWEGFDGAAREEEEAMLADTWLPEPQSQRLAFVCEVEDFPGLAGVYVLQPNGLGRCSHVAQGAYMVAPGLRGRGLGKQLCAHSLREAQRRQYKGMQFDMVVATNVAAIKAWSSCGFKIMCTLPGVFRHPSAGFVDAHVMFHDFGREAALEVTEAACAEGSFCVNEDFAAQLEGVEDLSNLPKEPARTREFSNWMIWMVHRAWLNDPTLVDFDFSGMHMPDPHLEERIAPKLMKAMQTNTYIEVLSLTNANVHKSTAIELAEALGKNCTLRTLNLDGNNLDSHAVRELAISIGASPDSSLEHLRLNHQRQMGAFFGRPTEEAVGLMMQKNRTIVKLGFECDDGNWRNIIDRSLLRNNDFSRRASLAPAADVEELPAEEKILGQVRLREIPVASPSDVFAEGSDKHSLLRSYMAHNLQLPTTSQLQQYAKNSGAPMAYTTAVPLIRECRAWLLDRAVASEVSVQDAFGVSSAGTLRSWQGSDERWVVELLENAGGRISFRADREPAVFLSPAWAPWINRKPQPTAGHPIAGGA